MPIENLDVDRYGTYNDGEYLGELSYWSFLLAFSLIHFVNTIFSATTHIDVKLFFRNQKSWNHGCNTVQMRCSQRSWS